MTFEQSNEQPSKTNILTNIMWKNYQLTHILRVWNKQLLFPDNYGHPVTRRYLLLSPANSALNSALPPPIRQTSPRHRPYFFFAIFGARKCIQIPYVIDRVLSKVCMHNGWLKKIFECLIWKPKYTFSFWSFNS